MHLLLTIIRAKSAFEASLFNLFHLLGFCFVYFQNGFYLIKYDFVFPFGFLLSSSFYFCQSPKRKLWIDFDLLFVYVNEMLTLKWIRKRKRQRVTLLCISVCLYTKDEDDPFCGV